MKLIDHVVVWVIVIAGISAGTSYVGRARAESDYTREREIRALESIAGSLRKLEQCRR